MRRGIPFYPTLRTVPTFATGHTFCGSRDGRRKSGFLMVVHHKKDIFCAIYNYAGKQILARVIGIRKQNCG